MKNSIQALLAIIFLLTMSLSVSASPYRGLSKPPTAKPPSWDLQSKTEDQVKAIIAARQAEEMRQGRLHPGNLRSTPGSLGQLASTYAFIQSMGINIHVSQGTNQYGNLADDEADLTYLFSGNPVNLRDSYNSFWQTYQSSYSTLASPFAPCPAGTSTCPAAAVAGTYKKGKWDFVSFVGGDQSPTTVTSFLSGIQTVNSAVPGSVYAVEGPNEINNFPVTWTPTGGTKELNSTPTADNLQTNLYSQTKADSAFPGVQVFYFTGYCCGETTGPNPSTTSGLADFDTQHPYPGGDSPPAAWLNPAAALPNESAPFGPAMYTETGYNPGTTGLTPAAMGAWTLDIFADAWLDGISKTYLYQLQGDSSTDGWGLYTSTNAVTTPAVDLHNFTSILNDTSASANSYTPTAKISYSVSGTGVSSFALQKSNGATDIVVWNETSAYPGPSTTATVTLGAAGKVTVYDPIVGTTATSTNASTSSVSLNLIGAPQIVEVAAPAAPAFTVSPANTEVNGTTGSITDTNGTVWTIGSNQQIYRNGTVIASSSGVVTLFWDGTTLYQLNSVGNWYTQPLDGSAGTLQAGAPAGYYVVSPANTQVNGTTGSITDTNGTVWTIGTNQQVYRNGTVVTSSAGVVTLFWTGTALYQLNSAGSWYSQPLDGSAGTLQAGAPTGYVAPAPTAISVSPATATVTTTANTTVSPFTGIVITDSNANQTETAKVSLSAANGTLVDPNSGTDGSTSSGGILTITGTAAAVATDLDGLTFTSVAAQATSTTITAAITDTAGQATSTASTVNAGYTAPITAISVTPSTASVSTTAGTLIQPFSSIVITDGNANQTETAKVGLNVANGVLTDPNSGSDGSTSSGGVITVTGSATAVATDLDGLAFTPSAGKSTTTSVTASIKDTAAETTSTATTVTATYTPPNAVAGYNSPVYSDVLIPGLGANESVLAAIKALQNNSGVSCSAGTISLSTLTITNGIVTHC